jgi:hypothetical protein
MKKIPSFWWDMRYDSENESESIIVESDHKDFAILGEHFYSNSNVESAEQFIKDLQEGRKDFRRDRWDLT